MTVFGLRIDPDGTVATVDEADVAVVALRELGGEATVITLHSPHTDSYAHCTFVGWVADWGRRDLLALNVKAWALYGRSPIVGPMFMALDMDDDETPEYYDDEHGCDVAGERKTVMREPLPELFVEMMLDDKDWVGHRVRELMRRMLATLDDGYPVPVWNWPG